MTLLQEKWPYWSAPVSIVNFIEREKYYRESVLQTLGDLTAELGYLKIACRGLKKKCWAGVLAVGKNANFPR